MITEALALLTQIEDAIADEPCQPTNSFLSAGEPAAPNPGCTDVAVWVSGVEDEAAFETGCQVRAGLTLSYRVGWCYPESYAGPSEAEELVASSCFYGLMDAVWCAIVAHQSAGDLAGADSCSSTTLGPLTVDARQGGWVSATGTITIPYYCVTSS